MPVRAKARAVFRAFILPGLHRTESLAPGVSGPSSRQISLVKARRTGRRHKTRVKGRGGKRANAPPRRRRARGRPTLPRRPPWVCDVRPRQGRPGRLSGGRRAPPRAAWCGRRRHVLRQGRSHRGSPPHRGHGRRRHGARAAPSIQGRAACATSVAAHPGVSVRRRRSVQTAAPRVAAVGVMPCHMF